MRFQTILMLESSGVDSGSEFRVHTQDQQIFNDLHSLVTRMWLKTRLVSIEDTASEDEENFYLLGR